ncbi:MAG: chromosome segregation protein SMC [Oscillospiraceae bacterium]|nr:chromosome segregation protein SMC [Oscillospiraceae bacterium]
MYLKSLEVQGFKSFPDKTLIRFGDDITAIVGPNGSGKSNISDAILWVMGEQSTKTLRGSKMEDVIFGGTQKRAAVGFAEATLTLDNTDRALSYDADEVMVTRRYYRSGDSEYYINRQSARLRDIHEMFMDTGLGREGYSNIGQGRIDEILSLKSADRREIFEEAAGISKYRHRKEETERKLAHTEDNLLRIGDKVSELELQLEPLRVQSEKAKKYLELRDELQGVEVAVWLDKLEKLSAEAKKAEEDYNSASFVLQQAHEDLDKLYAHTEQMSADLRHQNEVVENLRVQVSMLEGAHQQIDGQIAVLRGTVRNNEENIRRNREDLQGQEDRSSGITAQLEQASARIGEIDALLTGKNGELAALQQQLTQMTANAQGLTRQFMQLRTREVQLSADLAAREADGKTLETGSRETEERIAQLREDMASGKQKEDQAVEDLNACRKELRRAQDEVTANNNSISGYTLRQATRAKRRDELAEEVQKLRSTLEGVQAKVRVFRAMEKDFEGYQKSVRQVMQEANRGALRNIHGPVSQLIRTDDSYTVAIEIALAGAMQQIVVANEQDGKAAIAYLKRTGGGRATFLPLSVITAKPLKETGLEACRGFVGIASDLVKCEKTYNAIVENLLGRIVIVENIDDAIAMAKKYGNRFKIVTLDGQVINAGGSMTGGSVNKEAGILSRANELDKLVAREREMTARVQELEEQFTEARRAAEEVEFQLNTAREQLAEAEKQVLTQEGLLKQHEIWLQAVQEATESAQRELDSLCRRQTSDREHQAAIRAQVKIFADQLEKTRQEIALLEGTQLDADAAVAKITDSMHTIRAESAALEAEKATAISHIGDLRVLQAATEGDKNKKLADIDTICADNSRLEEEIRQQLIRQEQNDAQIAQTRQSMNEALTEYARIEASRSKADGEIQEKNKSIFNMERACALLENKKETTVIEERNTIDKLWDTYGLTPGTAVEKRGVIESVASGVRRIAELKRKISSLGTPNLGAIEEYARVNERYTYLTGQRDDVLGAKKDLEGIIKEITQQMTEIFVTEFAKIDQYFGQVFEEMFGGGKGQLLLEDPENPLTCGIEIRVQPPGKQLKTITLLSGGEKAFVAIALYFAILKVRPTPFCMLDEIDAALDDRNVERFSSYLRNLSTKTQFIVITHRRGTMEASDVLYGVTMQEQGISKLLRLDLNQMEQYLGIME